MWPNEKTSWVVLYDDAMDGHHLEFLKVIIIKSRIVTFAQNFVWWFVCAIVARSRYLKTKLSRQCKQERCT